MAINPKDYLAKLPKSRRDAIQARARELIAEELTLAELREASAALPGGTGQEARRSAGSDLEARCRADMYLSTLRNLIEAMGGTLEIIAQFPDRPPVRINQLKALDRVS